MPWKINPFTKQLTYYERGVPPIAADGYVLKSSADTYEWAPPHEVVGDRIQSAPPSIGGLRVTNIWVNGDTGKLEVEYSDMSGEMAGEITSTPPQGGYRVTNIFVDSTTGKTVVEYDETNGGM